MGDAKNAQFIVVAIEIVIDQISERRFDEASYRFDIKPAAEIGMSGEYRDRLLNSGSHGSRPARGMRANEVRDFDDIARSERAVSNFHCSKRPNAASISCAVANSPRRIAERPSRTNRRSSGFVGKGSAALRTTLRTTRAR